MKALRTRRSSTRGIIHLLFLGREIVRQRDDRDDGDNGIYTHGHPHTAPPNNESYSDENSSDGAATDDECTPQPTRQKYLLLLFDRIIMMDYLSFHQ